MIEWVLLFKYMNSLVRSLVKPFVDTMKNLNSMMRVLKIVAASMTLGNDKILELGASRRIKRVSPAAPGGMF